MIDRTSGQFCGGLQDALSIFLLGEVGGSVLRRVPLDLSPVDHPGDLGRELLDELTDPGPVAPVPFDRVVDVKVAGHDAGRARSPSARNLGLLLSECDRRLTTLRGWQSQRRVGVCWGRRPGLRSQRALPHHRSHRPPVRSQHPSPSPHCRPPIRRRSNPSRRLPCDAPLPHCERRAGFVGAATSSTTRTCRLQRLL